MIRTSTGFSHNISVPSPINDYKLSAVKVIPYQKIRKSSQVVFGPADSYNADIEQQIALEDAAARMRDQFDTMGYSPKVQSSNSRQFSLGSGSRTTFIKTNELSSNFADTPTLRPAPQRSLQSVSSQTPSKIFGDATSQTSSKQLRETGFQTKSRNFMDAVMQTAPIQTDTTDIVMRPASTDFFTQTKDSAMLTSSAYLERRRERKGKGKLVDTTPFNTQLSVSQTAQPSATTFMGSTGDSYSSKPIRVEVDLKKRVPLQILDGSRSLTEIPYYNDSYAEREEVRKKHGRSMSGANIDFKRPETKAARKKQSGMQSSGFNVNDLTDQFQGLWKRTG